MIQRLKNALKRFRRQWFSPIRHPWRELQRTIEAGVSNALQQGRGIVPAADVQSTSDSCAVNSSSDAPDAASTQQDQKGSEGKFRLKEFRYGNTLVQAVVRAGIWDEGIFGSVYEEYGIASLVRSLAGRRAKILDIGGHIGGFSVTLASLLPDVEAQIYEYVPENSRMIQMNSLLNGLEKRMSVFNRAVGDQSDGFVRSVSFTDAHMNTGGTSVALGSRVSADAEGSAVSTIAAKDIVAGFDFIDVLKIDCEGSEFKILFSLDEEDYQKIGLITGEIHDNIEWHGVETNGRHWTGPELLDYLRRFYHTVTIQRTSPCEWGFLQVFTAADPRTSRSEPRQSGNHQRTGAVASRVPHLSAASPLANGFGELSRS